MSRDLLGWAEVTKKFIKSHYETEGYFGHISDPNINEARAKWIVQNLHPRTVLDLGSGRFTLVKSLTELGCYAVGIDISKIALRYCKDYGVLGTLSHASFLPFKDNFFDVVVGFDILEHIPGELIKKTVHDIHRVCKRFAVLNIPLGGGLDPLHEEHLTIKGRDFWLSMFSEAFEDRGAPRIPTFNIRESLFLFAKRDVFKLSYIKWLKRQEEEFSAQEVTKEALSLPIQRERIDVAMSWIETDEMVLDLGAGDLGISLIIRDKGNKVVALDFPKVLGTAKEHRGISRVAGEATYLPFRNEVFDAVFMGELVEHILDVKQLFSEVYRILKHEGKLILTTPNVTRLRNRLGLLLGDVSGWHEWNKPFTHIRYWTPQTLIQCLQQNNFKPVKYGAGRSLGGGPPINGWDIFDEEEKRVLKKIISRFTPTPLFLLSFICIEARKV